MIRLAIVTLVGILYSVPSLADPHWNRHHHGHHHGHHHRHHHYPRYRHEYVYVPERVVEYVPARPRYYAPPPPASYYRYDQRSPQGLVGGVVGSAMGYEIGRGDPLAAGIGAAAGAWLGNGFY